MQNVNGILCPSVQCSGPVLFPQESNFIAYILTMLQNCLCLHLYLYIFVGKNIKNWFDLKSRFVWLFKPLRPSSANASWTLLHCRENDISLHLSETFIDWSMFIYCKIVERSIESNPLLKKKRKQIFLFGSNPLFLLIRSSPVRFV